jgi:tubulinyl-Tyr carboxypeptidase
MTEALPIKCLEAFLIAIYLTTGIYGLDRFNISFKTRFNSIVYRHVVLGLKYGQMYGALGLSRRADLASKPMNGTYDRLSALVNDYLQAYKNYGHTVLRVRIGLPVVHDLKSFLTINLKAIVIQPNKTEKIEYERELDKVARVWRQTSIYISNRSTVPSASTVQPTGTLITTASLPNRSQKSIGRLNRDSSMNKTSTRINADISTSTTRDRSVPCVIRV